MDGELARSDGTRSVSAITRFPIRQPANSDHHQHGEAPIDRFRLSGVRRAVAEMARAAAPTAARGTRSSRSGRRERRRAVGGAPLRARGRRSARRGCTPTSSSNSTRACRPASTSSIACSAAASCPGSLVLLGGEPGIGKSTLLLQAAANMARTIGPVLYSSGEESEHQIKSRGERLGGRRRAAVSARRDLPRADPRGDRPHQAGAGHRRFGPDRVLAEVPVGAGQHRPGARSGDAAAVRGEGPERSDVSRRPRHEGRQPRRPEGARARRRHGAVLRRRTPPLAPRRARGQEPVRRRQRARRLRDDGGRPAAGAESRRRCSWPSGRRTRRARRCCARSRARARSSSRSRRSSAPAPTARRAGWRAASISSGCRCCSRCSRSAPA